MWLVSARDLQFRARRFVIAVVVTSLVFGIALAIDGMRRSVQHETPAIVALFGADQWIVARGATGPFTTTRVLGTATEDAVRRGSGVKRADAVVLSRTVIAGRPGEGREPRRARAGRARQSADQRRTGGEAVGGGRPQSRESRRGR